MTYCISDIHGHYGLFCRLMEKIRFSGGDRLYVLGDMIDKGPESIRLVRLLLSMPNAVCVAGNHEYDLMKYYEGFAEQQEGCSKALQRIRALYADGELLDRDTLHALEALPYFTKTERFIGVHAGLPVRGGRLMPPEEAIPEQLVYDRRFKDPDILPEGGRCVLYGHTPVRYLTGRDEILFYSRAGARADSCDISDYCKVHLDTGVSMSGVLGCVQIETCRCFYVWAD